MPGTQPATMGATGPWDWVKQQLISLTRRVKALENSQSTILLDQYQNAVVIIGPLNQTVTTGASFGNPGTVASTGLTGVGIAVYQSGSWHSLANFTYP